MDRALVTMDDLEVAVPLNAALEAAGIRTELVSPVDDVRAAFGRADPDLLVFTGGLRERPAADLLTLSRRRSANTLGLLEPSEPDPARLAQDLDLTAWMVKPVSPRDVVAAGQRLLERRRLQEHTGILGESPAIHEVLVKIEQIAPVSSTVLIEGESGTGKELAAQAIHHLSPRRDRPFIAVNCAALPETLLESELFGHEKGSFTGAAERRLGRFELADGGTLFLDEVGEMPPSVQVKLLRVLETRSFFRVGGTQPIRVDVRVIAASNRSLKDAVALGEFRDDLYYRLNVLNIYLPPLRERRRDVPILIGRFVADLSRQHGRDFRGITPEAMEILMRAPWPGNVRQLRNLIESMVVLAPGREIGPADIPPEIREGGARLLPVRLPDQSRDISGRELEFIFRSLVDLKVQMEDLRRRIDEAPHAVEVIDVGRATPIYAGPANGFGRGRDHEPPEEAGAVLYRPGMKMSDVERATIEAALRETQGNRRKAAEQLGIGERTLYRKIKEYGLN
jgi:DNA-binding NtrC family response regulator